MRAARWRARHEVRCEAVPVPAPEPNEALVAVEYVGLCGSDVEEFLHGPVVIRPPVTLGHEIVGTVAMAAYDGSGPSTGTRVVVDVVTGCGRCFWCQRHNEGLCRDLVVTGQHRDGGLADYVVARADRLISIPDGLDSRQAALAEPLAVAVRAVRKAGTMAGQKMLVVGGGTIGMLSAQVAIASGAAQVAVLEPDPERRRLIDTWGSVSLWHPDGEERSRLLDVLFPEPGIDVVLECAGRPGVAAEAALLVRRGGTLVLTGVVGDDLPIDTLDLVLGEKTVRGSSAHMWDDDVAVAVGLLATRRVNVSELITHTVPLDDIESAFEILTDPNHQAIKLLVEIQPPSPF